MSPQAREAHLRLSSTLPSRRHEWQPLVRQWGGGRKAERTKAEIAELKSQLLRMRQEGKRNYEMIAEFHITNRTILELIGPTR